MAKSEDHSTPFVAPRRAEEWNKCVHSSIKAMHQSLSVLYENVGVTSADSSKPLATESSDSTELDDVPFPTVVETFVKQSDCLDLLLRTSSKWPVKLPMNSIINVLARCLNVSSANVKSKPSLSELEDALPSLHGSALSMMIRLIICCGSNVLPRVRAIIDACIHSLAGAKEAKGEARSTTRGKGFQVLCLLVERYGWSRYLQSLSTSLIQELIFDICIQGAPKKDSSVTAAKSKQEVESIAQRKSKKKKKGKKQKGDSYSDLPVYAGDDTGNPGQNELHNMEATQSALELSHLIIQKADYSQVQTLVRSLLNTSKSLQREGPAVSSPYNSMDCRQQLYSALFSCATLRLGHDCNRKDTIGHFQATNLAISLLTYVWHSDSSPEIQKSCNKFLIMLRNTGNLNRPIVRRILPDEQISTKDITEVEREAERLEEEKKGLWKQLVDSQLELEAQRREIEQLRQTVARNKAVNLVKTDDGTASEDNTDSNINLEKSDNGDTRDSSDGENKEEWEKDTFEETKNNVLKQNGEQEHIPISSVAAAKISPSKEKSQKESISPLVSTPAENKKKRSLDDKEEESLSKKKAKAAEQQAENDDIDAMISDFVDTAPDQF